MADPARTWRSQAGRRQAVLTLALTASTALGAVSCSATSRPHAAPPPARPAGPAPPASAPTDRRLITAALTRSTPVRLQIPAIGVDTVLIDLGVARDGTLQVPPDGTRAGWFTGAPTPGERGPAIITGHVDWNGDGVFFRLHQLTPGRRIEVTRQDGSTAAFAVTRVQQVPKGSFPTQQVYGDVDHPALRLITCGGSFDQSAHSYRDNIVVFADLISTSTA